MRVRVYLTRTETGEVDLDLLDRLNDDEIEREVNLFLDQVERGYEKIDKHLDPTTVTVDGEWNRIEGENDDD